MVSSRRFCEGGWALDAQNLVRRAGSISDLQKAGFGAPKAGSACSPQLRCKSGLCYTAGAKSPFEAYIYVR
jgi:hypothetical protein